MGMLSLGGGMHFLSAICTYRSLVAPGHNLVELGSGQGG